MPTWADVDPAEITPEPVYRHRKALGWGTRRAFGRGPVSYTHLTLPTKA